MPLVESRGQGVLLATAGEKCFQGLRPLLTCGGFLRVQKWRAENQACWRN
jgi:hypothetical protein